MVERKNQTQEIYLFAAVAVFINLFIICPDLLSQRVIDYSQFTAEYLDSIRALVNDTARENYTIRAYRLTGSDKIIIDGHLDEAAWKNAEHRVGLLEKEPFPLVPMSEET